MRSIRKLIGVAVVTACALVPVAAAQAAPAAPLVTGIPLNTDPSAWKTGVPYLAWRGEHVRIVVCDTAERLPLPEGGARVEALLMDFSAPVGYAQPQIYLGSTKTFPAWNPQPQVNDGEPFNPTPRNCAAVEVVSDKAGLAQFKLKVYFGESNSPDSVAATNGSGGSFREYDVNVIWMGLTQAHLTGGNTNVSAGDSPSEDNGEISATSGGLANEGYCRYEPQIGNPKSLCTLTSNRQHVAVVVKGNFPLDRNYPADWGLAGPETWTLPDDWAKLAPHLALNGDVSAFDLHDDNATTKGHLTLSPCPLNPLDISETNALLASDGVDNCFGFNVPKSGFTWDRYSRVSKDLVWPHLYVTAYDNGSNNSEPVAGPFDPNLPQFTWLPDGKVDQSDAPMPPAEVTFSIDPALSGGTGGVGYLAERHKTDVYRRRQVSGSPGTLVLKNTAHELYAPFYYRHLVPTMRDGDTPFSGSGTTNGLDIPEASGVTGAIHVQPGNDTLVPRPTFLVPSQNSNLDSEYTDWQSVWDQTRLANAGTSCTWQKDPVSGNLLPYPLPLGVQASKVYTDEHGEAQIDWVPGMGFNFDALFPGGLNELNANGGCDLNAFYGKEIGFANVSATVNYPYQLSNLSVAAPEKAFFSVKSNWKKTLTAYPKGGAVNAGWIFVAHGQDTNGQPFRNEIVCFTWDGSTSVGGIIYRSPSMGGKLVPIPGTNPPLTIGGPGSIKDPKYGFGRQCTRTDDNGNAALEIGSGVVTKSVTAWFENEGINIEAVSKAGQFVAGQAVTSSLSDAGALKALVASGAANGTSAAKIKSTLQVQRPKIASRVIRLARVVHLVGKRPQMQVIVKGKPGNVAIRITITDKNGKTRSVTRIVRANKLVTVKHLRVSTSARRISVKIA